MATKQKADVAAAIDPQCLVFMSTEEGDFDKLIFVGDTPKEARLFAEGFNLGLTRDASDALSAFCGVDRELPQRTVRCEARPAVA